MRSCRLPIIYQALFYPLSSQQKKKKKKPDRSSSMDGLKKRMRERRLRRTGCVIIQASAVPTKVLKCAPFDNVCTWRVEV